MNTSASKLTAAAVLLASRLVSPSASPTFIGDRNQPPAPPTQSSQTAVEQAEKANWFSVAIKLTDDIARDKPLDPAGAAATIARIKEEGHWFDKTFGKGPTPDKTWRIITSRAADSKTAAAIVFDSANNTAAAFRGPMIGETSFFDILRAEPAGLYDKNGPTPTVARQQEIYAASIRLLEIRNGKLLPKARPRQMPGFAYSHDAIKTLPPRGDSVWTQPERNAFLPSLCFSCALRWRAPMLTTTWSFGGPFRRSPAAQP